MKKSKLNNISDASPTQQVINPEGPKASKIENFSFDTMVKEFQKITETFPDGRKGRNTSRTIKDASLCAFSIFYTQSPSFLSFQRSMQKKHGKNNCSSLFGINKILSDSQIRRLLDVVPPTFVFPVFWSIFDGLYDNGYLSMFRSYNNNFLVALDGTTYFSSNTIHCKSCSQTHHKNGSITYSHSAITPVIAKPGCSRVISLPPEFITPQDGHDKQDCENAAAKRWITAHGSRFKEMGVTITGDDLYCNHPICELLLSNGFDFILNCKEDSHSTLYEYVKYLGDDIQRLEVLSWKGKQQRKDTYRFLNNVPLRNSKDTLEVNWCELVTSIVGQDGGSEKIVYRNTFATNFKIDKENVQRIVTDGRTRWKIENENNNILKNNGYNLEHNFGHGKLHLSSLLTTLNLLAFLFHTVLDLFDERYCLVRKALPTRMAFFQDIRALTRYQFFENWDNLIQYMLDELLDWDSPPSQKFCSSG